MPRTRRLMRPSCRGIRSTPGSEAIRLQASGRLGAGRRQASRRVSRLPRSAGSTRATKPFPGVAEQLETGGVGIEAREAVRGGDFVSGGQVQRQTLDGNAPFAGAQVVQPDEAEGEHRGGIALGRAGDGRPGVLSVAQKGAREHRREAVFQVGFGAQLGQFPFRELAAQEQAEAFAEDQAAAAASQVGPRAARQVEQKDLALALGEALHSQFQAGAGGLAGIGDVAGQVAGAVPRLQGEARAADIQGEVFGGDGKEFLAGFQQRGLAASSEESLNQSADFFGAAAGAP